MDCLELSRGTQRAAPVFKALTEAGWTADHVSGSHHIFRQHGHACLAVAVHAGKLRRDVVRHICRRLSLDADSLNADSDSELSDSELWNEAAAPRQDDEPEGRPTRVNPRRLEERPWVETSGAEQAERAARAGRAEEIRRKEREVFRRTLDTAQLNLVAGDFCAVEAALFPALGDELSAERLCALIGYEILGDALFFVCTAAVHLATEGGGASFGSNEAQLRILRAFDV